MRNQHNIDPLNILSVSKRKLLLIKLDVYKSIECAFSLPLNSNSFQSFICYFNLLVVYSVGQYWSVQLTNMGRTVSPGLPTPSLARSLARCGRWWWQSADQTPPLPPHRFLLRFFLRSFSLQYCDPKDCRLWSVTPLVHKLCTNVLIWGRASGAQSTLSGPVNIWWMSKSMAMMSMMKKRKETRRNQRILEIFQVNCPS